MSQPLLPKPFPLSVPVLFTLPVPVPFLFPGFEGCTCEPFLVPVVIDVIEEEFFSTSDFSVREESSLRFLQL
jgi:hypothetical protein